MTILGNDSKFDWSALWADLLKEAGRGLLTYDGSRAAQAALAGLDAFEDAQERREQQRPPGDQMGDDPLGDTLWKLRSVLTPGQMAALLRLPREDQAAWMRELAEVEGEQMRQPDFPPSVNAGAQPPRSSNPPPYSGQPMPIHPLDGWRLQPILPLRPDGRLNRP